MFITLNMRVNDECFMLRIEEILTITPVYRPPNDDCTTVIETINGNKYECTNFYSDVKDTIIEFGLCQHRETFEREIE